MRFRIPGFLLCAWLLSVPALRAQPPAEILLDECRFTLTSPTEAKQEVHRRIRINHQSGLPAGTFLVYTDEFRTLSSFSGSISVGGRVSRKLKTKDVVTYLETDALVEQVYVNAFEPTAPLPFEVEYFYTVVYKKGIITFPAFIPVPDYDIPVSKAVYTLMVPESEEVCYKASEEPRRSSEKGRATYVWSFQDIPAVVQEKGMPELSELTPFVYACPSRFQYANTSGSQENWLEVGRWFSQIMPDNTALPEKTRTEVLALTAGCTSDLQRVRVLYDYLREHTRYVSIQLGIGGYSPSAPGRVATSGFGDCKALSFFMKQLLATAGVPSEYAVLSTNRRDFLKGYSSIGQMNHAVLCVPLAQDTLWVECTNPRVPLGYVHSGLAGHQALLVKETGGELVRIRDYPDSLRREESYIELDLSTDGPALVSVDREAWLDESESYIGFSSLKSSDLPKVLLSGLQGQADNFALVNYTDNFQAYDGRTGYVPKANVRFRFNTSSLARMSGDRIIVNITPFVRTIGTQRAERRYDYVVRPGNIVRDSVLVRLPEGYDVEFLPPSQAASSELAEYSLSFRRQGEAVLIVSEFRIRAGRMPAKSYPEFRNLARTVEKAQAGTLILCKAATGNE